MAKPQRDPQPAAAPPDGQAPTPKPRHVRKGKATWTPDGPVRPGQRTPFRKATQEEIERRVEYCAKLMVPGLKTKTEIHDAMRRKYGLHWVTVDQLYIIRAEKWLRERAEITAARAKRTGVNVLLDIMRTGTNGERLRAERALAEIYGYNAPRRHEVTGADGKPLVPPTDDKLKAMTTEDLLRLAYEDEDANGRATAPAVGSGERGN